MSPRRNALVTLRTLTGLAVVTAHLVGAVTLIGVLRSPRRRPPRSCQRRRRSAHGAHPGMRIPLAGKRASLRDIIRTIAREREVVTYRQALERSRAS